MINSRDIKTLRPCVAERAAAFKKKCKAAGIEIIFTSTYRDHESQDALYALGRTEPGKRVTNARGGQSYHNFMVAFDFVPVIGGKAIWHDDKLWQKCGEIGESLGLEWGGRWKGFVDKPHLQYTGGLTLAELRAGINVC